MRSLPKTVGRYRIIAKLGQGGMATALLAMSEGPGGFRKLSVIKQLRLDLCEDPEYVAMFLDEARIAALLNHPNVVQTNEVGEEGNIRFISMEYLQGQSLAKVLHRVQANMPLGLHLRVIAETLTGLHYVHQLADLSGEPLNVVHRDISPGNLFVTYDGQVKVLDFGIAKAQGGQAVTKAGSFKGKMAYVAPEQARAAKVDRRADVFSMGILLWEALAKRPFTDRDEDVALTLQNRVKGLEPSIDEIAPGQPAALRAVCKKALAVNPDQRYSSAKEFRDALNEAAKEVKGNSQDELATMMGELFAQERESIAATIAKTISTEDPFESDAAMLISWEATGSISLDSPILEEAVTAELTKGSYTPVVSSTAMPSSLHTASSRTAAYSIVGVALAIGALAYFVGSGDPGGEAEATAPPPVKVSETAEDPVPALESIQLKIEVTPADATLEIDGALLGANPFSGDRPLSTGEHELVASAPGYETHRQALRLDRDVALNFSLVKEEESIVIEPMEIAKKDGDEPKKDRTDRDRKRDRNKTDKTEKIKADKNSKTAATDKPVTETKRPVKPGPGDTLKKRRDQTTRKIDKDNPYN